MIIFSEWFCHWSFDKAAHMETTMDVVPLQARRGAKRNCLWHWWETAPSAGTSCSVWRDNTFFYGARQAS